jgi:hypothetical protein
MSRIDEINAILDDLGDTPDDAELELRLRDYGTRELLEVVADRAAAAAPAFNGGTVTGATTLAPATDAVPLTIQGVAGQTEALLDAFVDGGDGLLQIHADGSVAITAADQGDHGLRITAAGTPDSGEWDLFRASRQLGATTGVNINGVFFTNAAVAPADGVIDAGEVFLWFDKTNGASKLKIKGKSANGTVVQGEVALT